MYDSGQYHSVALKLINDQSFINENGSPHFYRMPGYPIFLAICYIFKCNPISAIIIQILLGSFIPILIFLLALTLFPAQYKVAKISSIISCFDIGYIIFSGLIMSEILFVIFFTLFLILFFNSIPISPLHTQNQSSPLKLRFLVIGMLLGFAGLIRPVGLPLLITSIFILLLINEKFSTTMKNIFLLTTGWLSISGIWLIRNFILTGYIFFHTLSGPHFLNHSAVRLVMMQKKITYQQAQEIIYNELKTYLTHQEKLLSRPLKEIEFCLLAEKLSLQYILKNPILSIKHFIINILKTTLSLYSSELLMIDSGGQLPQYSNKRGIKDIFKKFLYPKLQNKWIISVIYFEIIFYLLILLGFLIFIFRSFFDKEKLLVLIKTLPFVFCITFLTLSCGFARLRLPIESFLIILASETWIKFFKAIESSK